GLELEVPERTSCARTVPTVVPSVRHSSLPLPGEVVPSEARKYSLPLYSTMYCGLELEVPLQMSATITVPAAVPSVFHSSVPVDPSLALKYSAPLNSLKYAGLELVAPTLMSFTMTVPAAVPSDFHTSM